MKSLTSEAPAQLELVDKTGLEKARLSQKAQSQHCVERGSLLTSWLFLKGHEANYNAKNQQTTTVRWMALAA